MDQVKENELAILYVDCSIYGGDHSCIKDFGQKTQTEERTSEARCGY
jgi:hypothetical protein